MMGRRGARYLAWVAAPLLVAGMLLASAGMGLAANTRLVYFGAPPAPDVCPYVGTTDDPYPCGGGIDATGAPRDGRLYFSPTTVSTTTATGKLVGFRVQIANASGQTLTKVTLLGGRLAGLTTNPLYPPPNAVPPTDPRFVADGSLPTGFQYDSVYSVSGPVPTCTISGSSTTSPSDGLRCDFGNLAAGSTPTILTIVMRAPAAVAASHPRPWIELQVKEGSSSNGGNADSFYAVGDPGALTITSSTLTYVESYVVPPGGGLTTRDDFVASTSDPTASRISVPKTVDGDNARIEETGLVTDTSLCVTGSSIVCFGQTSNVDVKRPVNFLVGGGTPDTFGIVDPSDATKWLVAPLQLQFRWNAKELPGRVKASNLLIIHDGVVVSTICANDPPLPGQVLPCRLPTTVYDDRDLGVTVYSPDNGGWKPGYR